MNTVLDSTQLIGADSPIWEELNELGAITAKIRFVRVLTTIEDPETGNQIPGDTETLEVPTYFKSSKEVTEEGKGVPVGSFIVEGYTVGILPDWCNALFGGKLRCSVKSLGDGWFCHKGKISVARDLIEAEVESTPIQGYFVIQGGA
jgi:hypothetical protein